MLAKITVSVLSLALVLSFVPTDALAVTASKAGTVTSAIHEAAGAGVVVGSSDYYGSGNDDAFSEYGLTTFNFTAADFGGAVSDVTNADLTLTVNDRSFSDGDLVHVFMSFDTASDLDNGGGDFSALSYEVASAPTGVDASQFTSLHDLGTYAIPEMAGRAGGEMDVLTLSLDVAAKAALVAAINAGADFQIMVAATDDTHDITYSGVGNSFDPGDPTLEIEADGSVATEASSFGGVKSDF